MQQLIFIFLVAFSFVACAQRNQPKDPVQSNETTGAILDTNWTEKVVKSEEEWKKILTSEQFYITRQQGTERPFSSPLYNNHEQGVYLCICCQNPLFASQTKFNSGTGWPSYYAPYASKSIQATEDRSHGMVRTEVACQRCGAHLGHVFDDGPAPTGLRYCIDGVALQFVKNESLITGKTAIFAAGCFWCMEAIFEGVRGVKSVRSGYAGGSEKNPTYEQVGSGQTGHAEAIEVIYDPAKIRFADLVRIFFAAQDPTQRNGQGPDRGTQYRSIAFYNDTEEKQIIEAEIARINASGEYSRPVATEVTPTAKFWLAEAYHQDYVKHHPENPYVQHESIPRMRRTQAKVKEFFQ